MLDYCANGIGANLSFNCLKYFTAKPCFVSTHYDSQAGLVVMEGVRSLVEILSPETRWMIFHIYLLIHKNGEQTKERPDMAHLKNWPCDIFIIWHNEGPWKVYLLLNVTWPTPSSCPNADRLVADHSIRPKRPSFNTHSELPFGGFEVVYFTSLFRA